MNEKEKDNSLFEEYETLLKAYRSGDENAFSDIYEKSKRFVYATCYGILNNEEEAEDAMQETYLAVFSNLDGFDNDRMFIAWVKQIAAHKSLDMCKKRRGNVSYDDAIASEESLEGDDNLEDLPDYYITEKVRRRELERIMREKLSEVQYQTVHMYYYDELSVEKIAELMDCPEGTVKTRLKASRIKIKEGIKEYEEKNKDAFAGALVIPFLTRFFNVQSDDLSIPSVDISSLVGKKAVKASAKEVAKSVSGRAAKETVKHGFLSTVAGKIVIGLIAAAVIVPSAVVVSKLANKETGEPEEETEEVLSEIMTPTPTPVPEPTDDPLPSDQQVAAAYYEVVSGYQIKILQCQNNSDTPIRCINFTDITGDNIPECIVRYCADSEDQGASDWLAGMGLPGPVYMKVFILTYNPDDNSVTEIYRRESDRDYAAWFSHSDIKLLDDGHIVVFYYMGGRGYDYYINEEYVLTDNGYELINTWNMTQENGIITFTHNDEPVSEAEFNDARDEYDSRAVATVMPAYGTETEDGNFLLYEEFAALAGVDVTAQSNTMDIAAVNMAYANILIQYEEDLRLFDSNPDCGFPSCTYEDISGDGVPELIIQYAADSEAPWQPVSVPGYYTCASLRIFTYDPTLGEAVEMFYIPQSTLTDYGYNSTDIAMLDNGHILIAHSDGEVTNYTEYEVQRNSLMQINELRKVYDNYEFVEYYYYNDVEITDTEFDNYLSNIMNSTILCLTQDVWFDPELDPYYDWEMTMYNHCTENLYYYDEMMSVLAGQ